MKYLLFILLLAGCNTKPDYFENLNLDQLYAVEDELTAEIKRLKDNLRDAADEDDIEDLEDEIEDLEDELARVRKLEGIQGPPGPPGPAGRDGNPGRDGKPGTATATVTGSAVNYQSAWTSKFCTRTYKVRKAIKKVLNNKHNDHLRSTPIVSCHQVTQYMVEEIDTTVSINLNEVESFKAGDLDDLPESVFLDVSDISVTNIEPVLTKQVTAFNNVLKELGTTLHTGSCGDYDEDAQDAYKGFYGDAKTEAAKFSLYTHGTDKMKEAFRKASIYKSAKDNHARFKSKSDGGKCNTQPSEWNTTDLTWDDLG